MLSRLVVSCFSGRFGRFFAVFAEPRQRAAGRHRDSLPLGALLGDDCRISGEKYWRRVLLRGVCNVVTSALTLLHGMSPRIARQARHAAAQKDASERLVSRCVEILGILHKIEADDLQSCLPTWVFAFLCVAAKRHSDLV